MTRPAPYWFLVGITLTTLFLVPAITFAVPCGGSVCMASNGNTEIEVDTNDEEDGLAG